MGPPRRARSNSSVSNYNAPANHNHNHNYNHNQRFRQPSTHPPLPDDPPHQDPVPQSQSALGMSSASRYMANMKVVRSRDRSIVSIFDQFSHVCVYHHNGDKWEKQGYEGSMFLYERDSYPPYGLYIMNRVGMDDYIQRLYPEDSVGVHGSYLMMRHYPDFTARRLSEVRSKLPLSLQEGPATKFAQEFAIADPEKLQDADKGRSQTVGLWCFATDAREPMTDVVMRLHGYIKKNLEYPDEYRYGPDRPPPPNFRSMSRASERGHHTRSASSASNTSSIHSISESGEDDVRPSASVSINGRSVSELDKLFAKLGGAPSNGLSQSQQVQTSSGTSGSETTAASLLASFCAPSRAMSVPPPSSSAAAAPTRGLALLDTIFASATPPPVRAASRTGYASHSSQHSNPQPTHTSAHFNNNPTQLTSTSGSQLHSATAYSQNPHILSPKPTSTALPQVLNQEVISTLLGLPPSRASSVRYEGDNEASDDGASEPGSMTSSIPQLSVPTTTHDDSDGTNHNSAGRILGDATPRPALRGFGSDINQVSDLLSAARVEQQRNHHTRHNSSGSVHLQIPQSSSGSTIVSTPADTESTPTIHSHISRPNANPNPNPITNPTPTSNSNLPPNPPKPRPLVPFEADSELWPYPRAPLIETDSDVLELDFADMSALSDPDAFERYQQRNREKDKGSGKGKGKKGKKDVQRERDEIERSWDVPDALRVVSPPPAPAPAQTLNPTTMVNGTVNGKKHHVRAERSGSVSRSSGANTNTHSTKVDVGDLQTSLLSALAAQGNPDHLGNLSKKDFVSEVLSLFHTDKQFVDNLWRQYTSQTG
ncbi:hypothetical protein HYDPIDRAFT_115942 [Hydnomerulius pinastri MD-312]|uniref:Uncharacterized protein n=1 Tax=Hydnomerulius pinastri MD-312 TaxID=994086 RepID=A0A0C9W4N2_9AGAM|nr:hypothetical protein HYDPIDRAFT_115942 [Hydnomerulius pinastri MD-312]